MGALAAKETFNGMNVFWTCPVCVRSGAFEIPDVGPSGIVGEAMVIHWHTSPTCSAVPFVEPIAPPGTLLRLNPKILTT